MDTRHAVGPQVFSLSRGMFDADFAHGPIVFGEALEARVQLGRDGCATEGGEPPDLGSAQDGQDAGDDGDGNPGGGGAVLEPVEMAVVVEKLGDEKIRAEVLLEAGVGDIRFKVVRLGMALGITGAGDAKVEIGSDVLDEISGVGELVLAWRLVLGPRGTITPESDDILDVGGLESLEHTVNFLAALGHAGQVSHHFHIAAALESHRDFFGEGPGCPRRPRRSRRRSRARTVAGDWRRRSRSELRPPREAGKIRRKSFFGW